LAFCRWPSVHWPFVRLAFCPGAYLFMTDIGALCQLADQGTQRHLVTAVCSHRPFHFSMCRSDELTSANDPSAALCLQLGTPCHLLSSTVTLSLYFSLG